MVLAKLKSGQSPKPLLPTSKKPNIGAIDYENLALTAATNLTALMKASEHPKVRAEATKAMLRRLSNSFAPGSEKISWTAQEKQFLETLNEMSGEDWRVVESQMFQIYLEQREALTSTDRFTLTILRKYISSDFDQSRGLAPNYQFRSWREGIRPLTRFEELLYHWLLKSNFSKVQQKTGELFTRIVREIEYSEEIDARPHRKPTFSMARWLENRLPGFRNLSNRTWMRPVATVTGRVVNFMFGVGARRAVWLSTLGASKSVANLTPTVLDFRIKHPEMATFLLEKWRDTGRSGLQNLSAGIRQRLRNLNFILAIVTAIILVISSIIGAVFFTALLAIIIQVTVMIAVVVIVIYFAISFFNNSTR
jgi:hypothetical protein